MHAYLRAVYLALTDVWFMHASMHLDWRQSFRHFGTNARAYHRGILAGRSYVRTPKE